jgi:hypothetical protein
MASEMALQARDADFGRWHVSGTHGGHHSKIAGEARCVVILLYDTR